MNHNATHSNDNHAQLDPAAPRQRRRQRHGKVVVLLLVMLPSLVAVIGLVIDGSMLISQNRIDQQVTDSAASAAAMELLQGQSDALSAGVATNYIQSLNGMTGATISVDHPPLTGPHAGSAAHVEVTVTNKIATYFMHAVGCANPQPIVTRSVAGYEAATAGAAIVVLDPAPSPLAISLPLSIKLLLPALPTLVGGLEIIGVGRVRVDGAVVVNTQWGGIDENLQPVGSASGPPYAVSCMPLLALTKLQADDVRVVGGVDNPDNYLPSPGESGNPLQANRLAVPDPLLDLPAPTTTTDPTNVNSTLRGGVSVVGLPIIGPTVTLQPGVYEWIEVVSGKAVFQPGVYIIRNSNPITKISLSILAGQVTAKGVMFYITNSAGYTPASGLPDSADGKTMPANSGLTTLLPSVVINIADVAGILPSTFSPLASGSSPFNGMMIYQRRQDRRPIVLVQTAVLGTGSFNGGVYAKWGHVLLAGMGTYDARFVSGTARVVALLDVRIKPTTLLAPAYDVFLVE